ncbi:MAG: hypothetical protein ACLTE2_02260 [Eubacteriales bacterium]
MSISLTIGSMSHILLQASVQSRPILSENVEKALNVY